MKTKTKKKPQGNHQRQWFKGLPRRSGLYVLMYASGKMVVRDVVKGDWLSSDLGLGYVAGSKVLKWEGFTHFFPLPPAPEAPQ